MPTYQFAGLPPTTNHLFYNAPGRGRGISGAYQRWIKGALSELMIQKREPITGHYIMAIILDSRKRAPTADVSNRIKAIEDLCVRAELVTDDRFADRVTVEWGVSEGTTVIITAI